jgi:hypothetical protein
MGAESMQAQNQVTPFFAGAFVAYLLMSPSNDLVQDKTIYLKYCKDYKHNSLSCPGELDFHKTEYKVFLDRQIVTEGGLISNIYKDCIVFDRNNWRCQHNGEQIMGVGPYGFNYSNSGSLDKDGKQSQLPKGQEISAFVYYVHSAEYYVHSTIKFFRSFFG